jgi:RNA polymerase sigma-70 factor (ECF subfamily)
VVPRDRSADTEAASDGIPGQSGAVEGALLLRLRAGDPAAFRGIVEKWSPSMLQVARGFVRTQATAEEVVQETWLAVIRGLDGFEGRSSLRTWTFHILINLARRRGVQDSRQVPWSRQDDEIGPTVDPARFRGPEDQWAGGFRADCAPQAWGPESQLLSGEIRQLLRAALEQLPARQRAVVALRDVDGLSADEVCEALNLSPANQRVLLHRARAKLRELLENYYRGELNEVSV